MNNPVFFLLAIISVSCINQNSNVFTPVVDFSVFEQRNGINAGNIIENNDMPEWLFAYINGGNEAVERLETFSNKYVFIGVNEGSNLNALKRWADNISAAYDFPMLVAERVEKRMIATASFFPDDEYGAFFEVMVKSASSGVYSGSEKEGSHWIRVRSANGNNGNSTEKYMFFVLITIDKLNMQSIIRSMLTRSSTAVRVTTAQGSAINRLRQNFFEGF